MALTGASMFARLCGMNITRAELRKAVEIGIERAKQRQPSLTDTQATILRHVAATTTRVTCGDFDIKGCGCPLTQAGLAYLDSENQVQIAPEVDGFWQGFDHATWLIRGGPASPARGAPRDTLEVTG